MELHILQEIHPGTVNHTRRHVLIEKYKLCEINISSETYTYNVNGGGIGVFGGDVYLINKYNNPFKRKKFFETSKTIQTIIIMEAIKEK